MKKTTVITRIMVIVMAMVMAFALAACGEKDTSLKNISVEVNYGEGGKATESFTLSTRAVYGIDALNELSQSTEHTDTTGEYPVYTYDFSFGGTWSVTGLMIITVNNVRADYTQDGKWWQIMVNGEASMRGISSLKIADGDKITLIVTKA